MHPLLTALLLVTSLAVSGLVHAQPETEPEAVGSGRSPLVIGTRQVPPFAMRDTDGSWSGIAIDLWAQIAERLNLDYRLVELDLSRMVDTVAEGEVDAVAAALTITGAREERVDFTQPF